MRTTRHHVQGARTVLRPFRQASLVAVAITGLLLMFSSVSDEANAQEANAPGTAEETPGGGAENEELQETTPATGTTTQRVRASDVARQTEEEAERTLQQLHVRFVAAVPKLAVALAILVLAWAIVRVLRTLRRWGVSHWERGSATLAITGIIIWLLAGGLSLSVLTGDLSGLVGGIGLVGLALSWALQTPIESFTGWLLNSFQGYYRVGDRIEVGDVFGDVAEVDFLTTTLWELGGPNRSSFIHAEQPTGRLITVPNSVVLTGTVINLTRRFPYVWDELTVHVEKEVDLPFATELLLRLAKETFGETMNGPARDYEALLRRARVDMKVSGEPEVFVTLEEGYLALIVRYLVGARERRRWKTALLGRILNELKKPEHVGRVFLAAPRQQLQFIDSNGQVRDYLRVSGFSELAETEEKGLPRS